MIELDKLGPELRRQVLEFCTKYAEQLVEPGFDKLLIGDLDAAGLPYRPDEVAGIISLARSLKR